MVEFYCQVVVSWPVPLIAMPFHRPIPSSRVGQRLSSEELIEVYERQSARGRQSFRRIV